MAVYTRGCSWGNTINDRFRYVTVCTYITCKFNKRHQICHWMSHNRHRFVHIGTDVLNVLDPTGSATIAPISRSGSSTSWYFIFTRGSVTLCTWPMRLQHHWSAADRVGGWRTGQLRATLLPYRPHGTTRVEHAHPRHHVIRLWRSFRWWFTAGDSSQPRSQRKRKPNCIWCLCNLLITM